MKTKTYKIILLPSENSSKLLLNYKTLHYDDGNLDLDGEVFSQHLYIISNEINEGDNIVCIKNGTIANQMGINKTGRTGICVFPNGNDGSVWVKIIASTDKSLELPWIPKLFIFNYIEKYNRNNIIAEVELECENVVSNNQNIKINSDGSIIIHHQVKTYTKKEVIELLKQRGNDFANDKEYTLDQWIEENL